MQIVAEPIVEPELEPTPMPELEPSSELVTSPALEIKPTLEDIKILHEYFDPFLPYEPSFPEFQLCFEKIFLWMVTYSLLILSVSRSISGGDISSSSRDSSMQTPSNKLEFEFFSPDEIDRIVSCGCLG